MIALVIILYALFGLSFTIGKMILSHAQPFFTVGMRMLLGSFGLIGYILYRHRIQCYPQKSDIWYYVQLALFSSFIPYCLRSWSLQYLSTVKSALIFNIMPFTTALFAFMFYKEKLTKHKLLGLTIGFLGMVPIIVTSSPGEGWEFFRIFSLPELATIVAVCSLSYGMLIMQQLVKHKQCPPYLANAVSMLCGGMLSLTLSASVETNFIKGDLTLFIIMLAAQIIISNIICSNLQAHLLRHYSSTFLSFASFLSPLCASIYGCILLNETITWQFFVSFGMVIYGLKLYYYDDLHRKTTASKSVAQANDQ